MTTSYLQSKGSQYNAAEDGVPVNALKHVPLTMDLPGVDFVEELHHDKHIKHNGVVFRGRWVEGSVTAAVNVEEFFTWKKKKKNHQLEILYVFVWLYFMFIG